MLFKHFVLRLTKESFSFSTPLLSPYWIPTALGLPGFYSLVTHLSLRTQQKLQLLIDLKHVTAAQAWYKLSKARGKFWCLSERSGHFSKRKNKFFCPLSPDIHFLPWRRWMHVIWYFWLRLGWQEVKLSELQHTKNSCTLYYMSRMLTVSSEHAGLTSFGISLHDWENGISRFTRVSGDAPLPLGFGFEHPSNAARWLTDSLQPRVGRGNLVGFDSMAPSNSVLWN